MSNFEKIIKEKTDNELIDIYINSQDYQPEFLAIVTVELESRKIPINPISHIKQQKEMLDEQNLELGRSGSQFWLIFGFIAALLGGLWGIGSGYNYAYSKHRSSSGKEFYVFNESTRKYGRWMLIVGILVLTLSLLINFNRYIP